LFCKEQCDWIDGDLHQEDYMSEKRVPDEPVILDFDPETSRSHGKIKQVFQDEVARALWLMIGKSHLVGPGFEAWCLHTASRIRGVNLRDPESLFLLIHGTNHVMGHPFFLGNWEDNKALMTRIWKAIRSVNPLQVHFEVRICGSNTRLSR